jgi:hypothetical protein
VAQPLGAGHARDQQVVLERALPRSRFSSVARARCCRWPAYGYPAVRNAPQWTTGRRPRFRPASDRAGEPTDYYARPTDRYEPETPRRRAVEVQSESRCLPHDHGHDGPNFWRAPPWPTSLTLFVRT